MIKKLAFLSMILLPGLCLAGGITAKQTELFEIAGVKIGMTEAQAIKAVTHKYNISESKIKKYNRINSKEGIWYFALRTDNQENISVVFAQDNTVTPPALVVEKVSYSLPPTIANIEAIRNSLFKKYGKPFNSSWCQLKNDKCIEGTNVLTLGGRDIILSNNKYQRANYKLKEKQNKQNRIPNF